MNAQINDNFMAQITEDYVSFETAKLLKEKGFNEDCEYYYTPEGEFKRWSPNGLVSDINNEGCETWWWKCITPTQQMAMKWLRLNYNIHIEPRYFPMPNIYRYVIIHSPVTIENIDSHPQYFNTNEEACEAAIKYCLENLI